MSRVILNKVLSCGFSNKSATNLLLVGCGNIGSALCNVWKKYYTVTIVDPRLSDPIHNFYAAPGCLPHKYKPQIIILAVKPQILPDVVKQYKQYSNVIWISLAAGIQTAKLHELTRSTNCVRVMPNMATKYAAGITAIYVPPLSLSKTAATAKCIFDKVGQTLLVDKEDDFATITALSGSGPAFFYDMAQAMVDNGIKLGLSPSVATQLARQTLFGAGVMVNQSDRPLTALRNEVTSKGGTTEAGLRVFSPEIKDLVLRTMSAAHKRCQELS